MKICFFGDYNSIHIRRWINYFKNEGHKVYVISFNGDSIEEDEGVKVYILKRYKIANKGNNWKYIFYLSAIKSILKEIQPDIINAHYVTSYGFIASLSNFKPVVITAWGSDILITAKKNLLYKAISRYALNKAILITTESKVLTEEVKKISKTMTITVPMGVESKFFYNYKSERNVDDPIKIISLRALTLNSNIDIIIKAFNYLVKDKKYNNLSLIIGNDGIERDNLYKLVKDFGLQDKVKFIGFVERDEIIELMSSCIINVSIPSSDSTSVTLLEALCCGSINIVSDIPANNEWVENYKNGLIIKEMDYKQLSDSIEYCIRNSNFQMQCEKINRPLINERALWENNMNIIENEFKSLINKERGV